MYERGVNRFLRGCNLVVRCASLIVPKIQRASWLQKRRIELSHWVNFLVEADRFNAITRQQVVSYSWSSFADALWCRFDRDKVLHSYPPSARFCVLAVLGVFLALLAAQPRALWPWAQSSGANSARILVVRVSQKWHSLEPELLQDAASEWLHHPLVAGVATYAYRSSIVRLGGDKEDVLSARVTPEVYDLLGTKAAVGRTFRPEDSDKVVLSNAFWRRRFQGSTHIIGQQFYLNHQKVEVVGVLRAGFGLPGIDADILTPFSAADGIPGRGYEWPGVILLLAQGVSVEHAKHQLWKYVNETSFPTPASFDVLSAKDLSERTVTSWGAVILFAVLVILAFNVQALVRIGMKNPGWILPEVCKWWSFFALKSALLIGIVLLVSVDLVHLAVQRLGLNAHDYASGAITWIFVVGLTIALTWSIRDQNLRCRSCLNRMRQETFLGAAYGPLHAPSGFELSCERGHGALHVPVTWVSCLDSERWTDFDPSWREVAQNA